MPAVSVADNDHAVVHTAPARHATTSAKASEAYPDRADLIQRGDDQQACLIVVLGIVRVNATMIVVIIRVEYHPTRLEAAPRA